MLADGCEPSGTSCRRNGHFDLFDSPGSVGQGLPNVLFLGIRIGFKDLGMVTGQFCGVG